MADFDDRIDAVLDEEKQKKSASTILVELALQHFTFGVSTAGETFALPKKGPKVVSMLRGAKTSIRGQLARLYFQRHGRAAPQQALADALLVIEGAAQESDEQELYLRVARHGADLWLDIGDQTGRAVRISGSGWDIAEPPVLFRRTALMGPLPDPVRGGSLDDLWTRLNLAEDDRPLIAAALVAALHHDIPHPVIGIFGEQGSAKTTASKMITSILDPGPVPVRKPPRDAEGWVTAAAGSWVVALDNLSVIPDWLSDSICRACTGDGDVRRKLYTDGEHAVFAFRRVILLNGIDLGALRGDLGERLLPLHLERIADEDRRLEREVWQSWDKAHPRILGAVLDLATSVTSVLSSVRLESKPRMADFAELLAAVDRVLGTNGLTHYLGKQRSLATDSLTGDAFVIAMVESITGPFSGKSADLLQRLRQERPPKGWPTTARAVTAKLNRHAPALRRAGWIVTNDGGRNIDNTVIWTIVPPEMACKRDSSNSYARQNGRGDESTSQTSQEYGPSQDDERERFTI